MDADAALLQLGVDLALLSDSERLQLDELGYVVLEGVLSGEQVAAIRDRLDALLAEEGERAGVEVHQEAGTGRLADLANKGPEFEVCFTHPRVLTAVWYVLGKQPFHLSSLNSRSAQPGHGHQVLHVDGLPSTERNDSCQTSWLIDAFTEDNGPTRLVPRSHRSGKSPGDEMDDTTAAHPDEIRLVAPAGSVAVFPGTMWHGGTVNRSSTQRRVIHCYFAERSVGQQTDQRSYVRPDTYRRLSPAARWVLDVEGADDGGWAAGLSYHEWAEGAGVTPQW